MATMKRRRTTTRTARRTRVTAKRTRRSTSKSRTVAPSDFRGHDAISNTRRTLARGARKLTPVLNREVV